MPPRRLAVNADGTNVSILSCVLTVTNVRRRISAVDAFGVDRTGGGGQRQRDPARQPRRWPVQPRDAMCWRVCSLVWAQPVSASAATHGSNFKFGPAPSRCIIIIIIITRTIFIVLSSTAPALCVSSLWFIWAKVAQRQVAANSQAKLQT